MRFSWMLAATVLLVLATGVRCKRKFDGDFEFAEEVSRDAAFLPFLSRRVRSRRVVARGLLSDDRLTGRSCFLSFFLSFILSFFLSFFLPARGGEGHATTDTRFLERSPDPRTATLRDVSRGVRRARSLSDRTHGWGRQSVTIGNNNSGDSAEGWRSAVANCCETTTF